MYTEKPDKLLLSSFFLLTFKMIGKESNGTGNEGTVELLLWIPPKIRQLLLFSWSFLIMSIEIEEAITKTPWFRTHY